LIQPISGEYAVRRELLETLSFPIGYGVETAHLIDVYQAHGLEALAQTDLDKRVHRNQPTVDLGKMAFGILQSFINRLRTYGLITGTPDMSSLFRQFQAEGSRYEMIAREMIEEERPPMMSIPEYRKRHGRK
jgi:glucosyl-3-phosphoglycerate synthase